MQSTLISPLRAKEARRSLGLSIKQLAEETSVNRSYLSMFENGKMPLAQKYQQALVDFFTGRKVDLDGLSEPTQLAPPRATQVMQGAFKRCFFLSPDLPQEQYDRAIEEMETNDERIAELLSTAVNTGVFSPLDAESESNQRELFGLLASNYVLFRLLQGHNLIAPRGEELDAQTQGDLLADWFAITLEGINGTTPESQQSAPVEVEPS